MGTNMFNPADRRIYPHRWTLCRGKQLFQVIDERSKDGKEELLAVSHLTGITPRSEKNVTMFQAESLVGYKICQVGDIVANTMWTWQGAIGVSKNYGVVSPAYNVYRQKKKFYNLRYLDYLLRERTMIDVYHSLSTGIRPSRLRLYPDVFLTIQFPVPPRAEQDQIVRFLDWKVSEIDKLIEIREKEIQILENMKDRILDDIMEALIKQCGLRRLKTISTYNQKTLPETTSSYFEFRYVDIGSVDAKRGITRYEKMMFQNAPSRARRIVQKNDIIISTVRTYLRAIARVEDDDNVVVSTGFAVITPYEGIDSRYLTYCFKSNVFCDEVIRRSIGIAYPSIDASKLMEIAIPMPSYEEQLRIGAKLSTEYEKINQEIETHTKKIKLLQELKTGMISDVVTGKIDVRDIPVPEKDEEVCG